MMTCTDDLLYFVPIHTSSGEENSESPVLLSRLQALNDDDQLPGIIEEYNSGA